MIGIISALWISLSACSPSFNFEGVWRGEHALPQGHANNVPIENSVKKVELKIQANGLFELTNSGIPKSGAIHTSGQEATLEVQSIFGKPVDAAGAGAQSLVQTIHLKALPDGSILFNDPGGFLKEEVRLKRSAQPTTP